MNDCFFCGRLTRDAEIVAFASGSKVAKFGVAVNDRKKNTVTGEWEDNPVFLDFECWNGFADTELLKGDEVFIKASAKVESWEKDGQRRSKVMFKVNWLQKGAGKSAAKTGAKRGPKPKNEKVETPVESNEPAATEDIPF